MKKYEKKKRYLQDIEDLIPWQFMAKISMVCSYKIWPSYQIHIPYARALNLKFCVKLKEKGADKAARWLIEIVNPSLKNAKYY